MGKSRNITSSGFYPWVNSITGDCPMSITMVSTIIQYNCVSITSDFPLVRLSEGRFLQTLPWFLWGQIDVFGLAQSGRKRT
jgi:hypothetical protein